MNKSINVYFRIFSNALSNWGMLGLTLVVTFFMSPFLVHTLGDEMYGIWSLLMSFSGYLSLLDLGIGSSLTRYISKYSRDNERDKVNIVINSSISIYLLIGIVILALSPLMAKLFLSLVNIDQEFKEITYWLLILTSGNVSVLLLRASMRGLYFGFQRYDLVNLVAAAATLIQAGSFYILLSNGFAILSMTVTVLVVNCIVVISYYVILRFKYQFVQIGTKHIKRDEISTIFNYSTFTFINMIANQVIYYTDNFVIGIFMNTGAITYYTIAWSLMEYLKKFCMSFTTVFVPVISQYEDQNDFDSIRDALNTGTRYTLIIMLPLCLGGLVLGKPFLAMWMGEKYATACSPILSILLFSQLFELPQRISNAVLYGISRHKVLSYASLIAAAINLLLSIVLIKRFGLIGVAIGTIVPQIILYGLFLPFYTNKVVGQSVVAFLKETYFRLIVPAIILFLTLELCVQFFNPSTYFCLLLEASLSTLSYALIVYLIALNSRERKMIITAMKIYARL